MKRLYVNSIILGLLIGLMPLIAEASDEGEALCRKFVEKAVPDYAQGGLDSIVRKNLSKLGVHCMPLLPLPSRLPDKQFKELRDQLYQGCVKDIDKNKEKITEMLKSIPADC